MRCASINSVRQLRTGAISPLLDSESSGVDLDEAVGVAIVAAAPDLALVTSEPFNAEVLESGPDLNGVPPLGMCRTACCQPFSATQPPRLTADLAGARRARFCKGNG